MRGAVILADAFVFVKSEISFSSLSGFVHHRLGGSSKGASFTPFCRRVKNFFCPSPSFCTQGSGSRKGSLSLVFSPFGLGRSGEARSSTQPGAVKHDPSISDGALESALFRGAPVQSSGRTETRAPVGGASAARASESSTTESPTTSARAVIARKNGAAVRSTATRARGA